MVYWGRQVLMCVNNYGQSKFEQDLSMFIQEHETTNNRIIYILVIAYDAYFELQRTHPNTELG